MGIVIHFVQTCQQMKRLELNKSYSSCIELLKVATKFPEKICFIFDQTPVLHVHQTYFFLLLRIKLQQLDLVC